MKSSNTTNIKSGPIALTQISEGKALQTAYICLYSTENCTVIMKGEIIYGHWNYIFKLSFFGVFFCCKALHFDIGVYPWLAFWSQPQGTIWRAAVFATSPNKIWSRAVLHKSVKKRSKKKQSKTNLWRMVRIDKQTGESIPPLFQFIHMFILVLYATSAVPEDLLRSE